jgi:hypothetical protein
VSVAYDDGEVGGAVVVLQLAQVLPQAGKPLGRVLRSFGCDIDEDPDFAPDFEATVHQRKLVVVFFFFSLSGSTSRLSGSSSRLSAHLIGWSRFGLRLGLCSGAVTIGRSDPFYYVCKVGYH